jgi:hypothetical protein
VETGADAKGTQTTEFIVYEPEITSFGLRREKVIWEFKKTREKEIRGNKELLLVIKTPKNSSVYGNFFIGAEVASRLSRWLPVSFKNKEEEVINTIYKLSEVKNKAKVPTVEGIRECIPFVSTFMLNEPIYLRLQ